MRRTVFFEILCVLLLALFIVFITGEEKTVSLTAEQIFQAVEQAAPSDELESFDKNKLTEEFGLDGDEYESWIYYGSEDVMNVRETVIIKLGQADGSEAISAIESRVEERKNLFESYSPEAFSLLENYVLKVKNGVLFFSVGEDADKALSVFLESIK